jgi:PBSX family phage portal protein
MSKRTRRMSRAETAAASNGALVAAETRGGDAFTFGDPEPALGGRQLVDMIECLHNDRWYEPPLPLDGLARAYRASPHHSSAIALKVNLIVGSIEPTPLINQRALIAAVQDYLVLGNAYFRGVRNVLGTPRRLEVSPARYTRRGLQPGQFFWVPNLRDELEYAPDSIFQLMRPDLSQEIYGIPEYVAALQSALLNENATLFRRKYYLNGSHAGYILYATGDIAENDTVALKAALKGSKGPGNFRSLFVHAPAGKDGSIKIMPIAEAGAKDEFLNIKNVTRDDVLAAHRVPPQLLGIVPQNAGGFGKVTEAVAAFFELEIEPILSLIFELNSWLGVEALRRKPRTAALPAPAA